MQLQSEMYIHCPYCGEMLNVLIDGASGEQSYYEDCSVCCAPILFLLTENESGEIQVDIKREDE